MFAEGNAYYNENDPFAAAWLRQLIKDGQICRGVVDERDIRDVYPDELDCYTQCHFFAGIGTWSYALRQAGWCDARPVWTGSCPCQPFSSAGKGDGFDDERHLWPDWHHLIAECRPSVVFGEQVASKDGLGWLDLVQADMEGTGYAVGAADLCAAGVGAPHIRQRLWFVGERLVQPDSQRLQGHRQPGQLNDQVGWQSQGRHSAEASAPSRMADNDRSGLQTRQQGQPTTRHGSAAQPSGNHGGLGYTSSEPSQRIPRGVSGEETQSGESRVTDGSVADRHSDASHDSSANPTNGFWRDVDWLFCRDGKWRPVEPSTFPMAHGVAGRVGRLRSYGNGIVSPVAQTFIEAYMEAQQ